jgi:hypothetical protein
MEFAESDRKEKKQESPLGNRHHKIIKRSFLPSEFLEFGLLLLSTSTEQYPELDI